MRKIYNVTVDTSVADYKMMKKLSLDGTVFIYYNPLHKIE